MSDENPYAPPTVAEPQADPALAWQVDGDSVLVKNGATLPQVDLLTGATGEGLVAVKRSHLRVPDFVPTAGVIAVAVIMSRITSGWSTPVLTFVLVVVGLILGGSTLEIRSSSTS